MDFSLKKFIKHYKSIYGVVTGLLCSIPVISSFFSGKIERYLFPPLGNFDTVGRIFAIVIIVLVSITTYFAKDLHLIQNKQRRFILLLKMLLACIAFYLLFFILNICFVKTITLPDDNETIINVSIGYERQNWAKEKLNGTSDYEILTKKRGPYEREIQNVWTLTSLVIVRASLLLSYISFFVIAVSISSLFILFDYFDLEENQIAKST